MKFLRLKKGLKDLYNYIPFGIGRKCSFSLAGQLKEEKGI